MALLKIEAFSGLSGDMFLGALAELADAFDEVQNLPELLHLENVEVKITEVEKAGIACRHVKIIDRNTYEEHTHVHAHGHSHKPKTDGGFSLAVDDGHAHHHHHAPHRHLSDIVEIIEKSSLTENAKDIANKIFRHLGEAESKVHGVDINTIHFHEVGAIDSILDIVGSAMLLDRLGITAAVSTPICTGHGFVMADHGRMPIPAPATKELLLGIPTYAGDVKGEMTTPTGAAVLRYLAPEFEIPVLVEQKVGHGPGEKDFEHPNVLRLSLCETSSSDQETVYMIETNIDDLSGELLGNDFQSRLLEQGALDFYYTQVTMKKGRPGILVTVFAPKDKVESIRTFLLEHTSTIGVRSYKADRVVLERKQVSVSTSLGEVLVKEVALPSGASRRTLEYESVREIANQLKKPINAVYSQLNKEI